MRAARVLARRQKLYGGASGSTPWSDCVFSANSVPGLALPLSTKPPSTKEILLSAKPTDPATRLFRQSGGPV